MIMFNDARLFNLKQKAKLKALAYKIPNCFYSNVLACVTRNAGSARNEIRKALKCYLSPLSAPRALLFCLAIPQKPGRISIRMSSARLINYSKVGHRQVAPLQIELLARAKY